MRWSRRNRDAASIPTTPRRDKNRFSGTWLHDLPVPVPRNYVLGIDRQKLDFEKGFLSYLRGEWRDGGWWYYYYAYGLLVKEPLGYIVLFAMTVVLRIGRLLKRGSGNEWYLLIPALLVFTLVSSQTGFSHHLRYVLPAFPFVFVWMGSLWPWAEGIPWRRRMVLALLVSAIGCSLWVFPHSHAYFNALAGGPRGGHNHLVDSNIDWGQDILLLADWVEQHPDRPLDGVSYSLDWLIDREVLGLPRGQPPHGYDGDSIDADVERLFGPQPGRYAIFVMPLRIHWKEIGYFRAFEPTEVIGQTVYIYEISPADVRRYWDERRQEP